MVYNNTNTTSNNSTNEQDSKIDIEEQKQIEDAAEQLLSIILKLVLGKLDSHKIVSGTIMSYNETSRRAVVKPVGESSNWTNIPNQSVYRILKPGNCVKMFCQDGNPSNAWIFSAFENSQKMETFGDEFVRISYSMLRQIETLKNETASLRRRITALENAASSTTT